MPQLQQGRHARVAQRTSRCQDALQRLRASLRQAGAQKTARAEEHSPDARRQELIANEGLELLGTQVYQMTKAGIDILLFRLSIHSLT